MDESILNRIPNLPDSVLHGYLQRYLSYRREVIDAVAEELGKRGQPVADDQLQAIRRALVARDTGRTGPNAATEAEEIRAMIRARRVAWVLLAAGLTAAAVLYLRAKPVPPDALGDMMDAKRSVRELQQYGGGLNMLLVQFLNWFEGLWEGRSLAGMVALLSAAAAAITRVTAGRDRN